MGVRETGAQLRSKGGGSDGGRGWAACSIGDGQMQVCNVKHTVVCDEVLNGEVEKQYFVGFEGFEPDDIGSSKVDCGSHETLAGQQRSVVVVSLVVVSLGFSCETSKLGYSAVLAANLEGIAKPHH